MKNISILVAAGLISTATYAQSNVTATAGNTNAPASIANIEPAIGAGMRNYNEGTVTGSSNDANEVGAYVTPKFTLSYKGPVLGIAFDNEFEMFTGRGYGDGKSDKGLGQNSYFQLHPMPVVTLKLSDNWSLKSTNDISYKMHTSNDGKIIEITSIETVENKINSNLTLAAGYRVDYASSYGKIVGATLELNKGTEKASTVKSVTANVGDNPTTMIHSAFVQAAIKFNDVVSYKVYLQAGKRSDAKETNSTANRFRMNNDVTLANAIPNTDIALRYRIQMQEPNGAKKATWLQLGRVVAGYNLSKTLTLELANEFATETKLTAGEDSTYSNENYLGVTYKF